MGILQSEHFVPRDVLSTMKMEAPTAEALRQLHDRGAGGFLIADDVAPRFYLSGVTLADLVDQVRVHRPDVLTAPLVGVLRLVPADGTWRSEFDSPAAGAQLSEPGLVPVRPEFLDPCDEAGWQSLIARPEHLAAPVVDRLGRHWGWILNHETVARTVHTKPPSYVCSLDKDHRFADPDHGQCRYCPGTLNRVS
jgi:hypothetical protein